MAQRSYTFLFAFAVTTALVTAGSAFGQSEALPKTRIEIIGVQTYPHWPTNMDGFSIPILVRFLDGGAAPNRGLAVALILAGGPIVEFYDHYSVGSCFYLELIRDDRFDRRTRVLMNARGFVLAAKTDRDLIQRQKKLPGYIVSTETRVSTKPCNIPTNS